MRAKNKNPLYVVKGDQVQAASGIFDMLIKKFNLEPLIDIIMNIFKMLMEQVSSYSGFMVIKSLFDEFMQRVELFKKYSIL